MRILAIVNPRSRAGATARRWPAVEAQLRAALGSLEVEHTRGPRDAERIAREGVRAGVELLLVAGGDGTLSETAAGLLGAGLARYAELMPLPLGTGGDFVRGLALPAGLEAAIGRLATAKARRIDAGRITLQDRRGHPLTTYFVNIASAGISGLVTELVNRAPKGLGGRASFLIGTLRGIARWRAASVRLRIDGETVHEGLLDLFAVANGSYFGGGMHVAPDARLDDGLFDVVWIGGTSRARLVRQLPRLYRGTHLALPDVGAQRGTLVEAEPIEPGAEIWVEVDGEPIGRLPARFELLPGALSLRGVGS
ncbi:diacylglycerol kinase family lipid kinase [Myxococcota bacterium]|nr:diacylglycerol kinase family lipid kinase [Myxococcota bacterium]MCZ7617799.1 diacylglycerol kinase family lipid kinase [Myxococcota bacterium]